MIVEIMSTDIDMSKVTYITPVSKDKHYEIHFDAGTKMFFDDESFPRKKFIKLWENSQVVAKPTLITLFPFKHLQEANAGLQIKSVVDWIKGQTDNEYHVVCFVERIETIEISMLSIADVDDNSIKDLQEKILARLEEMKAEIKDKEPQNDQEE